LKALLQRVSRAKVSVGEEVVGQIGPGLVVLLGVDREDAEADSHYLANRVATLRIFPDDEGKLNLSVQDVSGEVLVVSQFTLLADTRKGNRPSFIQAAPPEKAEALFEEFVRSLRSTGLRVQTGRFRTHMLVEILNDGPVTILLESKKKQSQPGFPQ